MRVLHLETGRHLYGGALQVLHLVEGLESREIRCLLMAPADSAVADEGEARGLSVERFRYGGEGDATSALRITSVARSFSPDLMHLHSRRGADTWGLLSAVAGGVPAVITRRVDNVEPGWMARTKASGAKHVIAISHAIERVLLASGVPQDQLSVVHSAVDVDRWATEPDRRALEREFEIPAGVPAVAMVAQFIKRKGHSTLMQALARVAAEGGPTPVVVLFGRGPLRGRVEEEASALGLSSWVRFAGFRDDLPRWLSSFDALVHPAHMEGLGVAALQAGAAGIPVIGSRAGGIPEIVLHEETGLLVEHDRPEPLARALASLLARPEDRGAMGEAARMRIAEHFSLDAMVEGNLRVYHGVLGNP